MCIGNEKAQNSFSAKEVLAPVRSTETRFKEEFKFNKNNF